MGLKKINKTDKIIVFIGLGLILAALAVYSYLVYTFYEVRELPVRLEVKEGVVGFNADPGAINFGKIMPGNSGERRVEVSFNRQARLVMKAEGKAAEWLVISPDSLVLDPGEKKEVAFKVELPEKVPEGIYEGKVKFYFRRI